MTFYVVHNFHVLTLFIWFVSILTLSISGEIKTDGNTSSTRLQNISSVSDGSKTEHQTLFPTNQSTIDPINSTKTLNKNVVTPPIAGEGGPISIIAPTQQSSITSTLISIVNNLELKTNLSKDEDNISYINKRKNTSKIVSRKGANEMLDTKDETNLPTKVMSSVDTKIVVVSSTIPSVNNNDDPADKNTSILITTKQHINNVSNILLNHTSLQTFQPANITQQKLSTSIPVTKTTLQEHKPKPTATIIEPNSDKHAFIPHSKGPRLGMPKKINYVLPVIVTLIALPLLGAIIFMVYKQGRDYWEKRHYRRMDFLIDGMYND